jgi:hypothetical protein
MQNQKEAAGLCVASSGPRRQCETTRLLISTRQEASTGSISWQTSRYSGNSEGDAVFNESLQDHQWLGHSCL